ncbi:MAG: hypothetical protein GX595_06465 [Lentisphaerae bacterium]|nr:hypothetical protein [Lentisphaerota bacterium]
MNTRWCMGWALMAVLLASAALRAAEAARPEGLPEAAFTALQASFPGATIDEVEAERERGVPYFEVEMTHAGREVEVEVTADGMIGEIETEVAAADLPTAVAAKAQEAAGGGRLGTAERHEVRGVPLYGTFAALAEPVVVYEIPFRSAVLRRKGTVVIRDNGEVVRVARGDDDGDEADDDEPGHQD